METLDLWLRFLEGNMTVETARALFNAHQHTWIDGKGNRGVATLLPYGVRPVRRITNALDPVYHRISTFKIVAGIITPPSFEKWLRKYRSHWYPLYLQADAIIRLRT